MNSHFQLKRYSYSFQRSIDKLNDLTGKNKCLALYSMKGIWLFNVQPFEIRLRD